MALVVRVIRADVSSLEQLERLAAKADSSAAQVGAARGVATVDATLLDALTRGHTISRLESRM